jgi:fumarate reductase subunit D
MAKSNEPFFWGLFAAGGMIAALFLPVTILLTSAGVLSGFVTQEKLWNAITHPLGRLYLFVIITFPLFHFAHRFRFTLKDIGFKSLDSLLAVICYGFAVAGTLAAGYLVLRI